jgi:type I site-specific restriction-modification system R (restriction) subunit
MEENSRIKEKTKINENKEVIELIQYGKSNISHKLPSEDDQLEINLHEQENSIQTIKENRFQNIHQTNQKSLINNRLDSIWLINQIQSKKVYLSVIIFVILFVIDFIFMKKVRFSQF